MDLPHARYSPMTNNFYSYWSPAGAILRELHVGCQSSLVR